MNESNDITLKRRKQKLNEKGIGEKIIEIMKEIDKLPEEAQEAIRLSIENIGLIHEICKNPGTTHKGLEERMEKCKGKNDYMGQVLAGLALQYMDEKEN